MSTVGAFDLLETYVDTVADYAEPIDRVLIVLVECTRRDYTMMQLTQYEFVEHAAVAVHQCAGDPIDVTYERLFAQLSRLPDGQLVAIFEDDLFLMPYSAQWFDFCAGEFKSGAHKRLFSCSFWNDNCFGQKKPAALSRYVRSHSFGGLGWMLRVDARIRQFAERLAESNRRQGKQPPWDAQMSDWFVEHDQMTLLPEMSRVRHVPHGGAKHLGLLRQSFMSTTERAYSAKKIADAADECDLESAPRLDTRDEYVAYFERTRASDQEPPLVIGGYPRQYYDGVHVRFDGEDRVHCALVAKEVFERNEAPKKRARKYQSTRGEGEEARDGDESQTTLLSRRRRYLRRSRRQNS